MTTVTNPIIPEELTQTLGLALLAHTADQVQSVTETESNLTSNRKQNYTLNWKHKDQLGMTLA